MNKVLNTLRNGLIAGILLLGVTNISIAESKTQNSAEQAEPEKGIHGGRLLQDGDFVVELSIFETGVPPEFRTWITQNGQPIDPKEVSLKIVLSRLGGIEDHINFIPQNDFLRGDMEIYEPHSFVVIIQAKYQGKQYEWRYDNFEGRVMIQSDIAKAMKIKTEIASEAMLNETIKPYGKLTALPEKIVDISARFDGLIKNVFVRLGQKVKKGQRLLVVESDESLKSYNISAPMDGYITKRNANPGEHTKDRTLFKIENHDALVAEFLVFPSQRTAVKEGLDVSFSVNEMNGKFQGVITQIDRLMQTNQSTIVRVLVDNKLGSLSPGMFVKGEIEVSEFTVPLAVKRKALQSFRDFTVVYAKIGDEYEVRMLELGRVSGDWIEVLGGLKPGTEYVTDNSYIIKADIEKSGASHDH